MALELKNLPLTFLGIKNFRSISDNGANLNELKKINLFIGKNNSGKSNFLKFISLFSNLLNGNRFQQILKISIEEIT